ncbi:helix-turn-helix transcriptional regulator [Erwinia sorbitola]|uniref:PAS domain-containing protein n=1 Tax=Erwinia sorbitola TaxID=2681984 RepID=A0A6I6EFZ2_9GAMM|nr:PAS domain-containing protein [Erwinia sorbitola]MTD27246.1 PAS domain-containing protein [Erwinia sorbitola]QGU88794.1 PAS domain-containing protein [Erwinia sorbitola]
MKQKELDRKIEKIITPLVRFWEGSNEPWLVKNNLSQFVYANKRMYNFIGLSKEFKIEGRYDGELPLAMHEFEPAFQSHDRMVEKVKDRVTSVEIHEFDKQDFLQPWYSEKFPIIDEDGTPLGVIAHCRPVESIFITRLSKIKIPTSLVFTPPTELFTDKEWEIIFYTCQLFTPKMIEAAIGVSNRTVEDTLCRIYKKAGVGNKRGLIDYCIEMGFNNFIPQSIFQQCDSIIPFDT